MAIVANAHVISAMPNGVTVEVDQTGTPFVGELLVEPIAIVDGQLQLSRAPGLGIELNDSILEGLRMADPLRVPPGSYSDMMFGIDHFPQPRDYLEVTP